jgi:DNA-binding GntR family transcriptional regulator
MLNDSSVRATADWVAYLENELVLLDRKNKAPKKATKTQVENEALKDRILEVLGSASEPMTATAIGEALGLSVNKVSALLTQLKEDNSVTREVVKRKAYFSVT